MGGDRARLTWCARVGKATLDHYMISFGRVRKTYPATTGPVHALDGVTFDVEQGEFVAVCGPSGCGKSTLLLLAGGLAAASEGRVVVAEQDLAKLSTAELARFRAQRVGFVFQMFHLLPYLNVVENVLVAADGRPDARDRANELLQRFQLGHRLAHRPDQLSVGERQRVAIARALLNQPPLLLADEPTGNLDPANAAAVLDLLSDFHRTGGTVLLVTHDESAAARAQRTIVLDAGRIVAANAEE